MRKSKDEYTNGLLNMSIQVITIIETQISNIKKQSPDKNTPRQIAAGGKLTALHTILHKMNEKKNKIEERILNEQSL